MKVVSQEQLIVSTYIAKLAKIIPVLNIFYKVLSLCFPHSRRYQYEKQIILRLVCKFMTTGQVCFG